MLRSIGMIACGIALLCSTVWADQKDNTVRLTKMLGTWQLIITMREDVTYSMWYVFNRMHFLDGNPALEGRDPFTGERALIRMNTQNPAGMSSRGKSIWNEYDFALSTSTAHGLEDKLVCSHYLFTYASVEHPDLPHMIKGRALVSTIEKDKVQNKPGFIPGMECLESKEHINQGEFVGIQR